MDAAKLPWNQALQPLSMTATPTENPVLTFEGKRYDLNALPDELKELVRACRLPTHS